MWLYLEVESFKRKLKSNGFTGVDPNPIGLVSLEEETMRTRTQRDDHVRTQGEGICLQATERGLRRNQPCPTLILDFQPLELRGDTFVMSEPPTCGA